MFLERRSGAHGFIPAFKIVKFFAFDRQFVPAIGKNRIGISATVNLLPPTYLLRDKCSSRSSFTRPRIARGVDDIHVAFFGLFSDQAVKYRHHIACKLSQLPVHPHFALSAVARTGWKQVTHAVCFEARYRTMVLDS